MQAFNSSISHCCRKITEYKLLWNVCHDKSERFVGLRTFALLRVPFMTHMVLYKRGCHFPRKLHWSDWSVGGGFISLDLCWKITCSAASEVFTISYYDDIPQWDIIHLVTLKSQSQTWRYLTDHKYVFIVQASVHLCHEGVQKHLFSFVNGPALS